MKYLLITSLFILSIQLYGHSPIPQKTILKVNTSILQKQINYTPIINATEIDTTKLTKNQKRDYTKTRVIIAVTGLFMIIGALTIPPVYFLLAGSGIAVRILVGVLTGGINALSIGLLTGAITGDHVLAEWEQNKQERERKRQLRKITKKSKASNR